jgi:hypothetical protein
MAHIIEIRTLQHEKLVSREDKLRGEFAEVSSELLASVTAFRSAAKNPEQEYSGYEAREICCALWKFFEALIPSAPADVIGDMVYIVVLYLMKESMKSGSQEAHALAEDHMQSEQE